jgi:hypothetical protein
MPTEMGTSLGALLRAEAMVVEPRRLEPCGPPSPHRRLDASARVALIEGALRRASNEPTLRLDFVAAGLAHDNSAG